MVTQPLQLKGQNRIYTLFMQVDKDIFHQTEDLLKYNSIKSNIIRQGSIMLSREEMWSL